MGLTWTFWARKQPQIGSVTGIVGSTGGLGGFVPPLVVMGAIHSAKRLYPVGFMLLSDLALAGCVYVVGADARRPVGSGRCPSGARRTGSMARVRRPAVLPLDDRPGRGSVRPILPGPPGPAHRSPEGAARCGGSAARRRQ
ncbi:hypothetical protein GCM10010381_09500 [Streptomyces xantholiticus]|nr:hypothetical protein GCM10010381_09500 [Streptomyces xantholiticus]